MDANDPLPVEVRHMLLGWDINAKRFEGRICDCITGCRQLKERGICTKRHAEEERREGICANCTDAPIPFIITEAAIAS